MNFFTFFFQSKFSKRYRIAIILFAGFILSSSAYGDMAYQNENDEAISVMTQNLFLGTDFSELTAARNFEEFVQAVMLTYQNVLATQPTQRMAAIAQEIAKLKPDLVGLQEAAIVRTGPTTFPATTATYIEIDMLDSLLAELRRLKSPYQVVGILQGLDAQAPAQAPDVDEWFDVRFTVQDVILVRSDRLKKDFKLSNIVIEPYQTQLIVDTAIGPVNNVSGYLSTVVSFEGRQFRFVTTHLAVPFFSGISIPFAQSSELIEFVSNSNQAITTVLVGDFNSSANDPTDPTFATYSNLLNAGFTDTWLAKHPDKPGFTCCQSPDVKNVNPLLSLRIDLVLNQDFEAINAKLVGNKSSDRLPGLGFWPSDHAGVFAKLVFRD